MALSTITYQKEIKSSEPFWCNGFKYAPKLCHLLGGDFGCKKTLYLVMSVLN
jgi:hypothetical protein